MCRLCPVLILDIIRFPVDQIGERILQERFEVVDLVHRELLRALVKINRSPV